MFVYTKVTYPAKGLLLYRIPERGIDNANSAGDLQIQK
jgi:hypothetical protein